jgi:hypothetical protein
VLASVVVMMEYVRRRILGMAPFAVEDERQFSTPPEKIKPPRKNKFPAREKRKQDS